MKGTPLLLVIVDHTRVHYFDLVVLAIVLGVENLIVHVLAVREEEIAMEHVDREFLTDLISGGLCDCKGDL